MMGTIEERRSVVRGVMVRATIRQKNPALKRRPPITRERDRMKAREGVGRVNPGALHPRGERNRIAAASDFARMCLGRMRAARSHARAGVSGCARGR